jgi:glycosyltransferase involved in cell wall biosynthesis
VYLWLQGRAHRRFDAVIAVSRVLADDLARRGIRRERLHLLPNAHVVTAEPYSRAEARERLGIAPEAFRLGWIGRLSREKGADVLLAALARVPDAGVEVSFVGDGPERAALEAQAAALGIAARVRWHGVVPDAARYTAAFDAVTLSSRTEGTPITLLEAMAAGTPVVATRVGGVPDVLTPAEGELVEAEDPAALAGAIERIRRDPTGAAARARAGRVRLATHFGPAAWLDEHVRVYRMIAAPRAAASFPISSR